MRKRLILVGVGVVIAVALMSVGSAAAATVVGSDCGALTTAPSVSVVSLKNPPGYPLPDAIPSEGVITSWAFTIAGVLPPEYTVTEKLKVFAPTSVPGQLTVVGESAASVSGGTTISPARIPVHSGDLIGSSLTLLNAGKLEQGAIFCKTENSGDEIAFVPGDPLNGATVSTTGNEAGFQNPINLTVEPDADGDGYGDETQDQCPTDASTQGPCPAKAPPTPPPPAPPTTLSASAAAKKTFLTVSLTTTAQASVTVTGTVKIGKGKTVKLSGNTQTVALGALAKFTVLFPAKLKAALKQLPTNKKLTINLSASAPGATTKTLTVKVAGQKLVRHHPGGKA
jgi:hypothetical protein